MTNVAPFPKPPRAFYSIPTVREMLIKGFQLPAILEVEGKARLRLGKELKDGGGHIEKGRSGEIFMSTYREKLESLTAEELAELEKRAELFKDISLEKLSDVDWRRLATMGWC